MSYSKRKVSSQEKSLSVCFACAKSYFSFDSQTARVCDRSERAVTGTRTRTLTGLGNLEVAWLFMCEACEMGGLECLFGAASRRQNAAQSAETWERECCFCLAGPANILKKIYSKCVLIQAGINIDPTWCQHLLQWNASLPDCWQFKSMERESKKTSEDRPLTPGSERIEGMSRGAIGEGAQTKKGGKLWGAKQGRHPKDGLCVTAGESWMGGGREW